jgi:hypothetical protein
MHSLIPKGLAIIFVVAITTHAAGKEAPKPRAKPPQWSQEVRDVFFVDARRVLVGTRPVAGTPKSQAIPGNKARTNSQKTELAWSTLIEAETLQTEIKRVVNGLASAISTTGKFKGGGHQQCLQDFSLLSIWFGVIEEFDQRTRWQKEAAAMRRQLEQTATLCEEANDQSHSAAKQVVESLTDLLRGQSPDVGSLQEDQQVDRAQLMLRMEQSVDDIIGPAISSNKNFRRRSAEVVHETQLLAVLAKIITAASYESTDEKEFSDYARQLGEASTALAEAAKEKNYEAARSAAGQLTQSCSACHEDFRG